MAKKNNEIKITTLLGKGCVVSGDFSAQSSTRIDGKVDGNVTVSGSLILGVGSVVNGDISATAVLIGGEVNGNINAPEKAELTSTANVQGNISTGVIVIDENAVFHGNCDMSNAENIPGKKEMKKAAAASERSAEAALQEATKEAGQE